MKQLSVIVPVYNGEHFIGKCLDSLLAQKKINLDEIEILAINDGSKDKSAALLRQYEARYPNTLTVVDQENRGAAATRNKGINMARGKYVTLVDQDDWVEDTYVSTLLAATQDGSVDVVQVGYRLVDSKNKVVKSVEPVGTHFGRLLAIPAWAKLYKTSFLRNNNISFFENNIGEDSIFTIRVWLLASTYKTIQYSGYNNFFDNQSNVTNSLHKGLSGKVNIIPLLNELIAIRSDDRETQELLNYNTVRTGMYYLLSYGKYATRARFKEVANELFHWFNRYMPQFKSNKYIWKHPKGERVSASFAIKLMVVLHTLRLIGLFARVYTRKGLLK